jgi:putative peptidoglycan lipid II flippase
VAEAVAKVTVESAGEKERKALAGRAGIVGAGTLVSRLLGLLRDQTLAALFSRGETDAFWVAFTLPNALRSLLGEGATSSAVVPVLAQVRAEDGDDAARGFFARMRGASLCALATATVLGIVAAPWLVELVAAGLHARPGAFERTVLLTRWVFPYIFFMGTAALGMAALNTYGRFAAAAFAPGLLNVAFIAAALGLPVLLARAGYDPILSLAAGALVGGALQVVAQWPSLAKIGFASLPRFDFRDRRVREALSRLVPMMAGIGIYTVDLVLSRRFLSELPEGSQSYFSWAMRLCDFPQGIFVLALQAATLPSLAKLAAARELDEVSKTYAFGMRLTLFVAIPATALFAALARPLVVTLFQRGAFDAASSTETAHALVAQGLGIWTVAATRQLLPVFYALGDTRTPVLVSALDLVVFIAAAVTLRGPLGHVGVSIAVSASSFAQMVLLWLWLGKRLPSLRGGEIIGSAGRTLLASIAAAAAGWATAAWLAAEGAARMWPGVLGGVVFAAVFLVACRALRSPELDGLLAALRRRKARPA